MDGAGNGEQRSLGNTLLVAKASARVLATTSFKASQGVLRSALLTDRANDPPVVTTLPVIRPTTQHRD
jgi:hypothetical protein